MNNLYPQAKQSKKLTSNAASVRINGLVTGFDPFNEAYENPSAAIAVAIPSYLHLKKNNLEVSIKKLVLPTAGDKAWSILKAAIDKLPTKDSSILVMVGQAANRKVIGLERFALNFRDYKIKDNAGQIFLAEPIDKKAPDAIRTKAPLEAALKYLISKGIPIEASNYAGTFVCNETYFRAMNYINQLRLPHMVYFVHVPLPRIYSKALAAAKNKKWTQLAKGKENQLAAMGAAIKLLIQFSAEVISQK